MDKQPKKELKPSLEDKNFLKRVMEITQKAATDPASLKDEHTFTTEEIFILTHLFYSLGVKKGVATAMKEVEGLILNEIELRGVTDGLE